MRLCGVPIERHYYHLKPYIPRRLQLFMRGRVARWLRRSMSGVWPIDPQAGRTPEGWLGWPGGKRFALVLTHDVDTFRGHQLCRPLMQLEMGLGFRSAFNFVAASYPVSGDLRHLVTAHGFEVGVHGLVHSRELYQSREVFLEHAAKINDFLRLWDAVGFRSPCMYHNLDWLRDLDILYDASTFDTDPFEPQPTGVGTIFPFQVPEKGGRPGYIELPYTLPQDFTLFVLFKEKNVEIWKRKLDWVAEQGGMALINTHPDYMNFEQRHGMEEYPVRYYQEFLQYVATRYAGQFWHALPREVAAFAVQSGFPEQLQLQGRGLIPYHSMRPATAAQERRHESKEEDDMDRPGEFPPRPFL